MKEEKIGEEKATLLVDFKRSQFIAMIYNYLKFKGLSSNNFRRQGFVTFHVSTKRDAIVKDLVSSCN